MTGANSPHSLKIEDVYKELSTGTHGLDSESVIKAREQWGSNALDEGRKKTFFGILLDQLKNLMLIVLFGAALVSLILEGFNADFIIIIAVILLNALMGAVQESKAMNALDALKKMSAPFANVIRDGKPLSVKASELVPGDLVLLAAGDSVPADIRLTTSALLKVDEAMLTGESLPVEKDASAVLPEDTPLAERVNMAYSGTNVTYGRGQGIVCYTGMRTEIGKIAGALKEAKEGDTPLQKRMDSLSKLLSVAVLVIAAVIFAVGVLTGRPAIDMFLVAVSLAVAAIPEGLATVVTLQLTMGVQKMSRRGAIVRKLPAVETLGCTNVICSDKTGTLTQNSMSVLKAFYNGREYAADALEGSAELKLIDRVFLLCNDTQVAVEEGRKRLIGDPTETALYAFAAARLEPEAALNEFERVLEIPFDSERKLMSTVNGSDEYKLYVKGAPDALIERCTGISINGKVYPLDDNTKAQLQAANEKMAGEALRVIAAAYKPFDKKPESIEGLEENLVFVGLAGMMDPPRPEAKDAVATCRKAGITPVMITGDHKTTATAIARELGILTEGAKAITGRELDGMDDSDLAENIDRIKVYARVAPEHKVRIVKAFRSRGSVVSMTGDGVNDAPALKEADIGVGMGITGTEVSKNASDMVLTDDNFATIVKAVEEGRRIYRNIKKAVQFLLSTNLSEVLTLFVGTMLGYTVLHPVQILWINLVTDTFPALALGMEPAPVDIMNRQPRDSKQSFLKGMTANLVTFGTMMTIETLLIFFLSLQRYGNPEVSATMAFLTLGLTQLFHAFNVRSTTRPVFSGIGCNKWMFGALLVSALLQVVVVAVVPLEAFFSVTQLSGEQWLFSVIAAFAIIPISEIIKLIKRAARKRG
ncbi:MAG: calcium-translocating P-type ATPase, PMCA-type [Burkholderiales bacterium]